MAQCAYHSEERGDCQGQAGVNSSYCGAHRRMMEAREPVVPPLSMTESEQPARGRTTAAEAAPAQPPARTRAQRPAPDAEVVGAAMQAMLLKQESRERLRSAQARSKGFARDAEGLALPAGQDMPFKVIPRRARADATLVIDPTTGKPPRSIKPGWVVRHVRTQNAKGEPSMARVAEFEDYAYEVVRDSNNQPIRTIYGLVMQGPPEQYALRAKDRTPQGSIDRDEALAQAMGWADTVNQAAGEEVTRIVVSDEHRSERVLVGSGAEKYEE